MNIHHKALVSAIPTDSGNTCICAFQPPTGEPIEKVLNVKLSQIVAWTQGSSIQNAMPQLSPDDRELFLTGIADWDAFMSGK